MAAEVFLRRTHRVIAVLFLVTIPPAAYFSFTATGDEVSPVVYFPLVALLGLALTGTYLRQAVGPATPSPPRVAAFQAVALTS